MVKYFTDGTAQFFYSRRLSVGYFPCTPIVGGVAFLPLTTRSLRAHGFVVRSKVRGWGGIGVGLAHRRLLSRGSRRAYTGQHNHRRHAPCRRCGEVTRGVDLRRPLPRQERGWTAHPARGPPP